VLRLVPFHAKVTQAAFRPQVQPSAAPVAAGDDPQLMPDLRGSSAREAAIAAARRGLVVELKGSGRVVGQAPEPGTEIEAGSSCVLTLERP
jgi:hypothetical protein